MGSPRRKETDGGPCVPRRGCCGLQVGAGRNWQVWAGSGSSGQTDPWYTGTSSENRLSRTRSGRDGMATRASPAPLALPLSPFAGPGRRGRAYSEREGVAGAKGNEEQGFCPGGSWIRGSRRLDGDPDLTAVGVVCGRGGSDRWTGARRLWPVVGAGLDAERSGGKATPRGRVAGRGSGNPAVQCRSPGTQAVAPCRGPGRVRAGD
jgi:hypothetical protein